MMLWEFEPPRRCIYDIHTCPVYIQVHTVDIVSLAFLFSYLVELNTGMIIHLYVLWFFSIQESLSFPDTTESKLAFQLLWFSLSL